MDALAALFLIAALGEPALAGGPDAYQRVPPSHVVERVETAHHHGASRVSIGEEAVRAGDPVRLSPVFFSGPNAGGVERPVRVQVYRRNGVIVIGSHGRLSAGQAAAARGLPRD